MKKPVPGSEKARKHENKKGGNWGEEDYHRPPFLRSRAYILPALHNYTASLLSESLEQAKYKDAFFSQANKTDF